MLLCDIEGSQDLDGVGDETIDANAYVNEGDEAVNRLEVKHKDGVAFLFVCDIGDHGEYHEEGADSDD